MDNMDNSKGGTGEINSAKIISEISLLYELSMAVGNSLDLQENCEIFLTTLMSRKNLAYASVWINPEYLSPDAQNGSEFMVHGSAFRTPDSEPGAPNPGLITDGAVLVYANPASQIDAWHIPADHPLFTHLADQPAFSLTSADDDFLEMVTEKEISRGTIAIFRLGEMGFLKAYSPVRNAAFETRELRQLAQVIDKFSLSLAGCFAHQRARYEVAERQRIEQEIRASEIKFRTLYESTGDAVMVLGEEGFIECNEAALKMFGYDSRQQFLNTHPGEQSPPTQPDGRNSLTAANEHIAKAIQQGANRFEWLHRRTDGTDFPAEVWLTAMELDGKPVVQATVRDISARKQAEAERERLLIELEGTYRRYVKREWETFLGQQAQGELRVEYRPEPGLQAEAQGQKGPPDTPATPSIIEAPIVLRGQPIGSLSLKDLKPSRRWTDDEKALIETVAEQLAQTAENLRLFDETRQRADYEHLVGEITQKLRQAPNLDVLAQIASKELGDALGVARSLVKIGVRPTGDDSLENGHNGHTPPEDNSSQNEQ